MNNNPENVMKNLESYGKETGFTVPDGYYDDLYQKMMGKVVVEKQKTHHRRQILKFSWLWGLMRQRHILPQTLMWMHILYIQKVKSSRYTRQVE